ncbi:MAG: pyroglutamyl-peptidase I, partial [Firmicutes bacterium]|nr:pyroglutamyl-peptidase I [Bacillota bacterium]
MRTFLITGFQSFDQEKINPSYEAIKLLPDQLDEIQIVKMELPTVFNLSSQILINKINEIHPDVIIMIGQAGGRKSISIERVAINIDDASIPDNQGNQPKDQPIVQDGKAAYFSTLPIKNINMHLLEKGISSSISNTAGTFVCNHLMYHILHYLET